MRVFAAVKLVNAIGGYIRGTPEFVRRNSLPCLRVNPENHVSRIQRAADVRNPHLVFFEIVGETTRAGAFVARNAKVFASERAIGKTNSRVGTVHPCSAEPSPPQNNCAIALPIGGIAIRATGRHPDRRRTLPLPVSQKLICFDGNKRTNCVWRYGALKIESKIIWGIEEIRPELAGLMTHP